MIISTDADKAFDKNQYLFMMKSLKEVGIKGNHLNMINSYVKNPQ